MMPEPKPIVAAGEILLVKISGGKSQKMVETAFVDQFESHEGHTLCPPGVCNRTFYPRKTRLTTL